MTRICSFENRSQKKFSIESLRIQTSAKEARFKDIVLCLPTCDLVHTIETPFLAVT